MPKKKDKKSGDNKQKDDAKKTESAADKSGSDDKEKDLYLTQLRYLNEQLERYQLKCDGLQRQKEDLTSQCSQLEKEKSDIVEYLKRSLLEKEDEVEELTGHLERQRQAADKERDALQLQHSQLRRELQTRVEELSTENAALGARLASLEEFQRQKEQLMSKMASLEKQLAVQKEEHKADIHSLEMKVLLEKRRLELEMENQVAAMAAEVQHRVDQKVPETTRRALQENTEVKAQLDELSEHTHVLMKQNSALQDRKSKLRVDVDILEHMVSELSRTSCVRKKVVEQLTDKCQQLQAELKVCTQEHQQLQAEHKDVLAEMETLRQEQASLTEQGSENRAELSRLAAELQAERRKRSRMKSTMQEAALTVRQALMELHGSDQDQDQDQNQDSCIPEWKQLIQKLLVVLDRPSLSSSSTEKVNELQSSEPSADRAVTLDPASSVQFQLARYRPGDLCLVPPPAPRHKHLLPRSGAGPILPLHRKPLSQKTSAVRRLTSKHSVTKLT